MAAVATTKVVDGLAGKALGGKSGPGDDDLAVFVAISGVGGFVSGHLLSREDFKALERLGLRGEPCG